MSFMNRIFGTTKKEQHSHTPQTSVTVVNDPVDRDGYVFLSDSNSSQINSGNSPANATNTQNTLNHEPSLNKLYDEIPFQLSPAYEKLWLSNTTPAGSQSFKLREIDWDSLCYDFILEKSILQS